jgi:3-hydroxyacyl-[acyl-carrier-protein] dehydratase
MTLDLEAVQRLLPHRAPLLLVDAVDEVGGEPPSLRAHKVIDSADPVLAGHFPGRPIWPGVYTIEGLAQSCALLGALKATTLGMASVQAPPSVPEAVLAAVDVKLLAPVLAGQRLDYWVLWTHSVDAVHRFVVHADVAGRPVARGTLLVAEAPQ